MRKSESPHPNPLPTKLGRGDQKILNSIAQWVVRLNLSDAGHLGSLRRFPGLRVLVDGQSVWMRGESLDSVLDRRIRSIPDVEWFAIWPDHQLTQLEGTVPCGRLPVGNWQPLHEWLQLKLPRAGFAATPSARVTLKLVRSSSPSVANLLQTTWIVWKEFATSASQVRLSRLAFALSDDNRALVRGVPLPPIPGRRFVEVDGVVVPNGWRIEPNVGPLVVRQVLKLDENELALFSEDGSFERVPRSAFVQATRSAVRASNG